MSKKNLISKKNRYKALAKLSDFLEFAGAYVKNERKDRDGDVTEYGIARKIADMLDGVHGETDDCFGLEEFVDIMGYLSEFSVKGSSADTVLDAHWLQSVAEDPSLDRLVYLWQWFIALARTFHGAVDTLIYNKLIGSISDRQAFFKSLGMKFDLGMDYDKTVIRHAMIKSLRKKFSEFVIETETDEYVMDHIAYFVSTLTLPAKRRPKPSASKSRKTKTLAQLEETPTKPSKKKSK